jgi:hypothetical protein
MVPRAFSERAENVQDVPLVMVSRVCQRRCHRHFRSNRFGLSSKLRDAAVRWPLAMVPVAVAAAIIGVC